MKQYAVTLTIRCLIDAPSLPKAEERVEVLGDLAIERFTSKKWVDDTDITWDSEVEEE